MSDELRKPPVVDLEVLLQPIPGDNPSGENLRYSGLYDEISEARRADDNLNRGEWQTDLKVADFRRVVDLAVPALSTQTKDLQVGAWLTEALIKQFGFSGLRDGLKLLTGLQSEFWDTLHPEIEDGDQEGRANAMAWLDNHVAFSVRSVPFTGSAGYSYLDWEDSKTFEIPESLDGMIQAEKDVFLALQAQAEKENRVTGEMWRKEKALTRRAHIESINFTVEECWEAFNELNGVIEAKFERNQMPGLSNFKKTLEDIHIQIKKLLDEKRVEEPDEADEAEGDEASAGGESTGAAKTGPGGGPIQNRRDALKRLGEIADFFQKTEPHSPVAYLVQRAVKWGNMPLENWLKDVIKDESILGQLRQTLGFNTVNPDNETPPPGA